MESLTEEVAFFEKKAPQKSFSVICFAKVCVIL